MPKKQLYCLTASYIFPKVGHACAVSRDSTTHVYPDSCNDPLTTRLSVRAVVRELADAVRTGCAVA